jgi:CheY-like chemotaxis protein
MSPVHLLVVDDDPAVRRLLAVALPPHGFTVRLAAGGEEAVEAYRTHLGEVDLVLLDVLLPGPDGPQTLAALREIDPAVPCCFVSARTGRYSAEEFLAMGADRVIAKPFGRLAEFARVLREAATRRAG